MNYNLLYSVSLLALTAVVTAQDYQKNKTYCYNVAYSDKKIFNGSEETDVECSILKPLLPKEKLECANISLIILSGKKFNFVEYAKKDLDKYTCEMPENGTCLTGKGDISINGTKMATLRLHTCSNLTLNKDTPCNKLEIKLPTDDRSQVAAEMCRCQSDDGKRPCNSGHSTVANLALLTAVLMGVMHQTFNRY